MPIAVALGAWLYERHLMRDADDAVIDAAVSSTPEELAAVVRAARWTLDVLGDGPPRAAPAERPNLERQPPRRSTRGARLPPAQAIVAPRT